MKVDVLTQTVIARPCGEVAAFPANPSHAPDWYVNIKSIEWKSEPVVKVGARAAFVALFLGKRLAYTYEILEFVANERLVMRTTRGPFPMETTYSWESTQQGGTRMKLRNRGEPYGFSQLMAPFISPAMRRANTKHLARLKALLESRAQ